MEVRAVRDFAETRKLTLQANDIVTVIDHGYEKGGDQANGLEMGEINLIQPFEQAFIPSPLSSLQKRAS